MIGSDSWTESQTKIQTTYSGVVTKNKPPHLEM